MSESSASSQLIDQAKSSLNKLDSPKLAEALAALVLVEPIRWRQLLLLAGLLPEPSPQKVKEKVGLLPKTLACLMEAIRILIASDVDHLETSIQLVLMLQGFIVLQAYYCDITDELDKLAFTKSPAEVQIQRLVALAEGQSRTIKEKIQTIHDVAGFIDPMAGHVSSVQSKFDETKDSLVAIVEAIIENIELGLRFILRSHRLSAKPTFQPLNGPYRDVEIQKYINFAGLWRIIAEQTANMRFRDWRWLSIQNHLCCFPANKDTYLREHAGALRYQLFMQDRILRRLPAPEDSNAYREQIRLTGASIVVPPAGEQWDGKIDLDSLKQMCSMDPTRVFVEEYVDHRHYSPLIDRVKIGSIGWREWVSGKTVLHCVAEAMSLAVTEQVPHDDLACMRQVVVVPESALITIFVKCGGLSEQQSRYLLNVFRFDPKRKSLEIWDQPLIPCGEELVFLVPTFATSGNPARALENFVTEWGGVAFDVRGIPFEDYVVREILARSKARAVGGIKIPREGEKDLQFDVIVWWEEYAILIEAKCEKAVFSAADYHRANRQIEKSIDQLVLRRQALPDVWSVLREKAPSLGLPESYVGNERVLCLSITNIMNFTGYARDGVVVTDDSCFFRFFGDQMVKKFGLGDPHGEDVEPIRASDQPSPSELIEYLVNPPQMRRLLDKTRVVTRVIPGITERSPGFFTAHIEFKE